MAVPADGAAAAGRAGAALGAGAPPGRGPGGASAQLEPDDLEGLLAAPMLRLAASLADVPPDVLPELLRERLNEGERALLDRAPRPTAAGGPAADCVNALQAASGSSATCAASRTRSTGCRSGRHSTTTTLDGAVGTEEGAAAAARRIELGDVAKEHDLVH